MCVGPMLRRGGDGKGSRARLAVGKSHKHLKNNTCSGVADESQDPATTLLEGLEAGMQDLESRQLDPRCKAAVEHDRPLTE